MTCLKTIHVWGFSPAMWMTIVMWYWLRIQVLIGIISCIRLGRSGIPIVFFVLYWQWCFLIFRCLGLRHMHPFIFHWVLNCTAQDLGVDKIPPWSSKLYVHLFLVARIPLSQTWFAGKKSNLVRCFPFVFPLNLYLYRIIYIYIYISHWNFQLLGGSPFVFHGLPHFGKIHRYPTARLRQAYGPYVHVGKPWICCTIFCQRANIRDKQKGVWFDEHSSYLVEQLVDSGNEPPLVRGERGLNQQTSPGLAPAQ